MAVTCFEDASSLDRIFRKLAIRMALQHYRRIRLHSKEDNEYWVTPSYLEGIVTKGVDIPYLSGNVMTHGLIEGIRSSVLELAGYFVDWDLPYKNVEYFGFPKYITKERIARSDHPLMILPSNGSAFNPENGEMYRKFVEDCEYWLDKMRYVQYDFVFDGGDCYFKLESRLNGETDISEEQHYDEHTPGAEYVRAATTVEVSKHPGWYGTSSPLVEPKQDHPPTVREDTEISCCYPGKATVSNYSPYKAKAMVFSVPQGRGYRTSWEISTNDNGFRTKHAKEEIKLYQTPSDSEIEGGDISAKWVTSEEYDWVEVDDETGGSATRKTGTIIKYANEDPADKVEERYDNIVAGYIIGGMSDVYKGVNLRDQAIPSGLVASKDVGPHKEIEISLAPVGEKSASAPEVEMPPYDSNYDAGSTNTVSGASKYVVVLDYGDAFNEAEENWKKLVENNKGNEN